MTQTNDTENDMADMSALDPHVGDPVFDSDFYEDC